MYKEPYICLVYFYFQKNIQGSRHYGQCTVMGRNKRGQVDSEVDWEQSQVKRVDRGLIGTGEHISTGVPKGQFIYIMKAHTTHLGSFPFMSFRIVQKNSIVSVK